ncbi:sigma-70 family RNA polymerase sigma factor [Chitinophaga sp. YIM B06452]|uniref:RNA polymerase sigma factor n=1 Tax=Chitinophaga sp. YIM B06452 TaxID=3082158 RepID=UPI0031FEF534
MQPEPVFPTEEILLAQLRAGNPMARQWLYDRYAAPLYGLLRELAPGRSVADELLVASFKQIFKNIHRYDQSQGLSLFSWLIKMSRETAIRLLPEERLTGNDFTHSISGMLQFTDALSEQCRRVFVLCYCKGLSRSEAAKKLDMKEEQVLSCLKEALIELRKFSRNI